MSYLKLILLLFAVPVYGQLSDSTFFEAQKLKGKIASFEKKKCVIEHREGALFEACSKEVTCVFDEKGRIIKQVIYLSSGKKIKQITYGASGQVIQEKTSNVGKEGVNSQVRMEYKYDHWKNKTEVLTTSIISEGKNPFTGQILPKSKPIEHNVKFQNNYDSQNRLVSQESLEGESVSYRYDKQGRLIDTKKWDGNLAIIPIEEVVNKYNKQGLLMEKRLKKRGLLQQIKSYHNHQLIEEQNFNQGRLQNTKKYAYDLNGKLVKKTTLKGTVLTEELLIKSSKKGLQKIVTSYHQGEKPVKIFTKQFNKQGWLVLEELVDQLTTKSNYRRNLKYNNQGDVIQVINTGPSAKGAFKEVFHYEYDEQGNWSKRSSFDDVNLKAVTYRKFTYYP